MKKLEKLLRKAHPKDKRLLRDTVALLLGGRVDALDVKKLGENGYRVRKGDYRIFFHYAANGEPSVDDIRRRNEGTYRDT